jgi:hypothetical protein
MSMSLQNIDKIVDRETHLKDINLESENGSRNVIPHIADLLDRRWAGAITTSPFKGGIIR